MLSTLGKRCLASSLTRLVLAPFSGGHHHAKPYDWRDDHTLNPFYEQDPRTIGCKDPQTYAFPYEAEPRGHETPYPSAYNPKDLTVNFVGSTGGLSVGETNLLDVPEQVLWDDIAHEWDY